MKRFTRWLLQRYALKLCKVAEKLDRIGHCYSADRVRGIAYDLTVLKRGGK